MRIVTSMLLAASCALAFSLEASPSSEIAEAAPAPNAHQPAPLPRPSTHLPPETFLTRDEALTLAFPNCEIERTPIYLTDDERKKASKLAGFECDARVLYAYCATRNGTLVGTAYFDKHRVRSLREVLMVVVAPDVTVQRIEVLSFAEPKDYIPRNAFYDQFKTRKLDAELQLNRKIRNVTGATLTARATTSCARRSLAYHRVIIERSGKDSGDS